MLAQQSGWPWQGPEQGAGYLVMPKEGKQQSEKRKNHRKTDRKKGNERIELSSASPPIYPSSSGTQPWGEQWRLCCEQKKVIVLSACSVFAWCSEGRRRRQTRGRVLHQRSTAQAARLKLGDGADYLRHFA
jgi:hypothetical protein